MFNGDDDSPLQHDCLRVVTDIEEVDKSHQVISYCLSTMSSKIHNQSNNSLSSLTFSELSERNITSEQLYLWSAPIDLIEDYQYYLNHLSTSNNSFLEEKVFYNCTLPRFGPVCEYEFLNYHEDHSSLHDIVEDFYRTHPYEPIDFTCYMHLQCDRGPSPACLDWTEVCNGKVDCLDGDFDEKDCWQVYTNKCQDNEYQCRNGQCIPQSFFHDNSATFDCLDADDKLDTKYNDFSICLTNAPTFGCEDRICQFTPLTTSCVLQRENLLLQTLFSIKNQSTSDECWSALRCLIMRDRLTFPFCAHLCANNKCIRSIERECPDMLYIPAVPVLFGHIYFAYKKNHSPLLNNTYSPYPYVCYNNSLYDNYFTNTTKILFNHTVCYYYSSSLSVAVNSIPQTSFDYLKIVERDLWEFNVIENSHPTSNYISTSCNRFGMYQCINSRKCVARLDLNDMYYNCPHGDDEIFAINNYVEMTGSEAGLISWFEDVGNGQTVYRYAKKNVSFQIICDGYTELLPETINGQNHTDETECEEWPCNNIYTRCNDQWNCDNGLDEVGCHLSVPSICPSDQYMCVSPNTSQFICLPVSKLNDGRVDCLGGTDEPYVCRKKNEMIPVKNFYCGDTMSTLCLSSNELCDNVMDCSNQDDEQFCIKNRTYPQYPAVCNFQFNSFRTDVELFLCERLSKRDKDSLLHFSLNEVRQVVVNNPENRVQNDIISITARSDEQEHEPRCHRGLHLHVWLDNENNISRDACLCPPSFYGEICQYQNQRVSVTVRFQALSDSREILFAMIISLIDDSDERIINSYEQFTYLAVRDCQIKFNVYSLYSTRPKNPTRNYSILIDVYEKISFKYRGSLLYPILFPFLPVYRLSMIVDIPRKTNKIQTCTDKQCHHGQCIRYLNDPQNNTFCLCEKEWNGRYCTNQHTCQCSSDALCVGVAANNRSICICPIDKFGPRCHLPTTVCHVVDNSPCENNGQCILNDDYAMSSEKFTCICRKGFIGSRCETVSSNITLLFSKEIVLSQSIFIHLIELSNAKGPARSTIFKTIPVRKESVVIYRSRPFHLVFTELSKKNYYLTVVQKVFNRSQAIVKMINPSDRCPHISEVVNKTLAQLNLLRRIKYYHLPCQQFPLDLQCFYDEVHLCLCYEFDQKRLANCLEFNHDMIFDCAGQSECENGGHCFQDNPDCPSQSICVCQACFYGGRCQFSTSGFGLSLDAILGYRIQPHVSLLHQPSIVQLTLAFTIIFTVAGLVNGILSLITFRRKSTRLVGCGIYLLGTSISTICTMIIFALKFCILVLAQMTVISNRLFLAIQCRSIDFLLQVCLNMDQWLNACVAMERAIAAVKATQFNRKKSQQTAKFIIIILLTVIIGSSLHVPIYRHLIDEENDDDEKRVWCIAGYSQTLHVFDSIIQPFHVLGPFIINLVSAIIVITTKSRQQSNAQVQRTYKEILKQQCRQQRHLFTASILLVILALPRIIIIFASKCMKSVNDSWLYLIGYFISFIPPMLTFLVFVLPSTLYREEFCKSVADYRIRIQRCLHLSS